MLLQRYHTHHSTPDCPLIPSMCCLRLFPLLLFLLLLVLLPFFSPSSSSFLLVLPPRPSYSHCKDHQPLRARVPCYCHPVPRCVDARRSYLWPRAAAGGAEVVPSAPLWGVIGGVRLRRGRRRDITYISNGVMGGVRLVALGVHCFRGEGTSWYTDTEHWYQQLVLIH